MALMLISLVKAKRELAKVKNLNTSKNPKNTSFTSAQQQDNSEKINELKQKNQSLESDLKNQKTIIKENKTLKIEKKKSWEQKS